MSGTFNLGSMGNNFQQSISKALDQEFDKVLKELQAKIPSKIQAIKSEVYGSYVTVIQKVFIGVFDSYYGNNYDQQSLLDSLHFVSGKDIRPDFSYDERQFKFMDMLNLRVFNQNASNTEFRRFQDPTFGRQSLNIGNRDSIIQDLWTEIDEYQAQGDTQAVNELLDYLDYVQYSGSSANNLERPENFVELSRVYEIARDKALEEFNKEFVSQLKPRIFKKYGIKV